VSGAAARALPAVTGQGREFADVLSGVALEGPAGRLAALLDPAFLAGAGWDPVTRVLSPPAGHKLLGRELCRAGGCTASAHGVTRASLQADLLAAHERALRLTARTRQLEKRLSEALGEQAWRESGLGAPADIDALHQKITHLEQQGIDLRLQLGERDQDLAAARAANRELMTQLNHATAATRR
jgi:hypothetical protein